MSQFAIFRHYPDLIYLDSAATCHVPDVVLEAVQHYYQQLHGNVHRGSHRLGRLATQALEQAREQLAIFMGAPAAQVTLQASTTAALNQLADHLPVTWQAGDEIVLSWAEHHANILPWQRLAQRYQLQLKYIEIDPVTGALGAWEHLLSERTKVVSVSLASNVTGAVFAVQPLLQRAQQLGAWTIVDAAQAAAHVPLRVTELGCDALVFSAHKTYGMTGCAPLYLSERLLAQLPPMVVGGGIVEQVAPLSARFIDGVQRFEAGSPNTVAIVAAATAVQWLTTQDFTQLQQLRSLLVHELQQRPWLTVLPSGENATPTVAFYSTEFHAQDIAIWLDQHDIAVRAGHHCAQLFLQHWQLPAVVRVSLGIYNTEAHIQRLLQTLDAGWALFSSD